MKLSEKKISPENFGKPVFSALTGKVTERVPFWLMRQAGRYLPEYREVRAKAGSFLDLAYNPELACEVTIQPLRRFNMDAAILFADILLVPQALGQRLEFVQGEGPKLDPVRTVADLDRLNRTDIHQTLNPVYEAVKLIRKGLSGEGFDETALIGFAGAPWTVACYMVEGGGSRDFLHIRQWAASDPQGFRKLIDILTESTAVYLKKQIEAGAEVVKLFDSWAGVPDARGFESWVIAPTRKIVSLIREDYPDVPIIGFPRGAGLMLEAYATGTGVNAVALDQGVPLVFARDLQKKLPVQGNLDPVYLLTGGEVLRRATEDILAHLSQGPFIFNLGHGIHKDTPPGHVAQMAQIIRGWKR